jgi:hypothetical protein
MKDTTKDFVHEQNIQNYRQRLKARVTEHGEDKGSPVAEDRQGQVLELVNAAAKTWRRLKDENQLPKFLQGVKFQNGIEVIKMLAHHAA